MPRFSLCSPRSVAESGFGLLESRDSDAKFFHLYFVFCCNKVFSVLKGWFYHYGYMCEAEKHRTGAQWACLGKGRERGHSSFPVLHWMLLCIGRK